VDSDVFFLDTPKLNNVSATVRSDPTPVDIGNRMYCQYMLDCDQPWVIDPDQYWCLSSVPFRQLDRTLLQTLRSRIQSIHCKNTFDLHIDLFESDKLVAYDPDANKMVMSEFQLIEIFRHRYSNQQLPVGLHTASNFEHTSIKDWQQPREWFENKKIIVMDNHWNAVQQFGKHHV
jgi:hypothetical protein